jgi:hypothetical protein
VRDRWRVRIVLGLGLLLVAAYLGRELSSNVPAVAGSNRVAPAVFAAVVPPAGVLCQPSAPLPDDAAGALLTIGTYGRPVPVASLRFLSPAGAVAAFGRTGPGAREGQITIPLERPGGAPPASELCLSFGPATRVAVAGAGVPAGTGSAEINRHAAAAVVSVTYYRRGGRTWWSQLSVLAQRFGRGKAAFFGAWTLPACALVLLGLWALSVRLLGRELT